MTRTQDLKIPKDATHWDSGDWIDWHRNPKGIDERPCSAAAEADPMAMLTALHVSLLRAAKTYLTLTGDHLPVYAAIAEVHAAIHFDRPMGLAAQKGTGIKLLHLPPHQQQHSVEVDLSDDFDLLVVVRIKDNFTVEARAVKRSALPHHNKGRQTINWKSMPQQV